MVLAVLVLAACGGDDDGNDNGGNEGAGTGAGAGTATGGGGGSEAGGGGSPKGTYVGQVTGSDAYIAVVSDGKRLTGYVCDGKGVSTWLTQSQTQGDVADLENRGGKAVGRVSFAAGTASGSVEVGGKELTFALTQAKGDAGLFRAAKTSKANGKLDPGEVEVGWVVLADGSQRGNTNFADPGFNTQPAPRLNPNVADVSVNAGGNAIQLTQQRVQRFIDPLTF